MDDLIKALQILRKYGNPTYPTHCEHDVLQVCIEPDKVSDSDKEELDKLGFFVDEETDSFQSFKFGNC